MGSSPTTSRLGHITRKGHNASTESSRIRRRPHLRLRGRQQYSRRRPTARSSQLQRAVLHARH
eukprot:9480343-Pyramimonas_sp.AAC.1